MAHARGSVPATGSFKLSIRRGLTSAAARSYNVVGPTPMGGVYKGNRMEKEERLRRLRTVEGHVRGIERMVEDDAYCIDVIRQIQAVQSALTKISVGVLDEHLRMCLVNAVRGPDSSEQDQVLREISEVYEMASKV